MTTSTAIVGPLPQIRYRSGTQDVYASWAVRIRARDGRTIR